MSRSKIVAILKEAKRVSRGQLLVSCPMDTRGCFELDEGDSQSHHGQRILKAEEMYLYGESSLNCHAYPVTQEILNGWFVDAGLEVRKWVRIKYKFLMRVGSLGGWGAVLVPAKEANAGSSRSSSSSSSSSSSEDRERRKGRAGEL